MQAQVRTLQGFRSKMDGHGCAQQVEGDLRRKKEKEDKPADPTVKEKGGAEGAGGAGGRGDEGG